MHKWEICKSQDNSPKVEKYLQTRLLSVWIQDWQHLEDWIHCSTHGLSHRFSNLWGSGNFTGSEKPRAPYAEMMVLSECLPHLNSLTCELQHCTHWKRKHRCLCHKHGVLHLDIQEGTLQWILDWLSSLLWHRNRSGVHLWVQNLGKVRGNVFIAEWSCHDTVSNGVTGVPSSSAFISMVLWYETCLCVLHLQFNT